MYEFYVTDFMGGLNLKILFVFWYNSIYRTTLIHLKFILNIGKLISLQLLL